MIVNRLRIENYRGLPDFDIAVRENAVFVGPNDSGKSSVLRVLDRLLGASSAALHGSFAPGDFTDPERRIVAEVEMQLVDQEDEAAFPDVADPEARTVIVRLEASMSEAGGESPSVVRFFPRVGDHSGPTPDQVSLGFAWQLVPASRSLFRELGGARTGVFRTLLAALELGDDADQIADAQALVVEALDAAMSVKALRQELSSALSEVFEEMVAEDDLAVALPGSTSGALLEDARISMSRNGVTRDLNDQSDGVRALTALVGLGLHGAGAKLVAVDEPEMHLHPTAARLVAQRLRNSAAQVFLSTHSSDVAAQFYPSDLIVFRRGQAPRSMPDGANGLKSSFVRRWWRHEYIQPLTARRILIVEGPTERILAEAVAETLGIDLHRRGVHLLELNGAGSFRHAVEVFGSNGFGSEVSGLVDEKEAADWAEWLGVEIAELDAHGVAVQRSDLEETIVAGLGAERVVELLVLGGYSREALDRRTNGSEAPPDNDAITMLLRSEKTTGVLALASALTADDAAQIEPMHRVLRAAVE